MTVKEEESKRITLKLVALVFIDQLTKTIAVFCGLSKVFNRGIAFSVLNDVPLSIVVAAFLLLLFSLRKDGFFLEVFGLS